MDTAPESDHHHQNDAVNHMPATPPTQTSAECLILVFVLLAAIALYALLRFKLPTITVWTAIGLPIIHILLISLVLLAYTPRQYVTTMLLALELAVVMLGATMYDCAAFRTPAYIIELGITFYIFWHLVIHAFLSVKGVKLEEMGCMGDIGNWIAYWIAIIARGIKRLWVGGLRTLSECVIGCENLRRDEEASPPPYHFSTFSDTSNRKGHNLV